MCKTAHQVLSAFFLFHLLIQPVWLEPQGEDMISLFADNDTPPRVERCSGNTGFVQQSNQLSLETKCTSKLEVKILKKKKQKKRFCFMPAS